MKDYKIIIEGFDTCYFQKANLDRFTTAESLAREAVYKLQLKSPFGKDESRKAFVYSLNIENGKIKETLIKTCSLILPQEEPSENQYREGLERCLKVIPEEFHSFVEGMAWDRGHSSGYREVLNIAEEIAEGLEKATKKYEQRLLTLPKNVVE